MVAEVAVRIPTILVGVATGDPGSPRVLRARDFGAVGDGVTDDTVALQAAIDALQLGWVLGLDPGAIYSVTNLTLPTLTTGLAQKTGIVGPATIRARSGGTTTYLVASESWVENAANGGASWTFDGIVFDGNDIAAHPFVLRGNLFHFDRCHFIGGTAGAFRFTRIASDGATTTASYLGNNRWTDCHFAAGTASSGALFVTDGADGSGPTDGMIQGCFFNGASIAPYCIDLSTAGGWIITGNQIYDATSYDVVLRQVGRVGVFSDNAIEKGMLVQKAGSRKLIQFGPGNRYRSSVRVEFTDDTSIERVVFTGEQFQDNVLGDTNAQLIHASAQSNKELAAVSCAFKSDTPMVATDGGAIYLKGCTSGNTSLATVPDLGPFETGRTGEAYIGSVNADTANAYLRLLQTSIATGQVAFNLRFSGRQSGGTDDDNVVLGVLTSYVVDATDGTETARVQISATTSGVLAQEANIGDGVQLGTPTGGAKGVGTLNAQSGVYVDNIPVLSGSGTPEGARSAPVGALYLRTDGGAGSTLYVKQSGTGNTGWAAK